MNSKLRRRKWFWPIELLPQYLPAVIKSIREKSNQCCFQNEIRNRSNSIVSQFTEISDSFSSIKM